MHGARFSYKIKRCLLTKYNLIFKKFIVNLWFVRLTYMRTAAGVAARAAVPASILDMTNR